MVVQPQVLPYRAHPLPATPPPNLGFTYPPPLQPRNGIYTQNAPEATQETGPQENGTGPKDAEEGRNEDETRTVGESNNNEAVEPILAKEKGEVKEEGGKEVGKEVDNRVSSEMKGK